MHERRAHERRRGLTLLEITIAMVVFAIIAYGMTAGARMGLQSERAVAEIVVESRSLHDACAVLQEELSNAAYAGIEHVVDEDGWSSLSFSVPIETESGGIAWGVWDRSLGKSEAERARVGYSLRYEAILVAGGGRSLVRRIFDDEGDLAHQEVLVNALAHTGGPGFTVEDTGAVWVVTIRYDEGRKANGQEAVLHVTSRN